ncbi:MAG TPA: AI-2E family transporter, partial [Thermodesulfobacteriota bacterium]|nr:AI-2E family transporter [Thermodesulfobacteriota bacterium]
SPDARPAEPGPRPLPPAPGGAPAGAPPARYYREILFALALGLGLVFVYQIAFVLKPFILAFLIGLALDPLVERLARYRINRYLAAVAVVLAAVGLVSLLVALLAPVVAEQARLLAEQGPVLVRRATDVVDRLAHRFPAIGEHVSGRAALAPLLEQVGQVFPLLRQVFSTLTQLALDTVLVIFLLVFGLGRPEPIRRFLVEVVPDRVAGDAQRVIARVVPQLRTWVVGLAIAMLSIGLLTLAGLLLLGVPYAFAFAVLAGLLEVVPLAGPIISALLTAVVTAAEDPTKALYVLLFFVGVQQFENHVLIPLVMSRALDLHPVLIAFLLLVMTYYLGVFGTFVAVPTGVVLVALYQEVYLPRAHPAGPPRAG